MLLIWGTTALSRVISHIIQSVNSIQKNIFKELYNHVCDDMLSRKIRVKCSSCLQELDSLGLLTGFFCLMFGGSIFSHLADNHNHHLVAKLITTFHASFTKQVRKVIPLSLESFLWRSGGTGFDWIESLEIFILSV